MHTCFLDSKVLNYCKLGKIFITSSTIHWFIGLNNIVINYFTKLLLQVKPCLHRNYPTVHAVTSVMKWKRLTFFIDCKCLDTFWTRISYVFKSCGVSKQVRRLQYLVIAYTSEPLDYKWINVLFNYIGFVIYKSYFCCQRRNKQSNILNVFIEELKDLETVILRISNAICWQPFWANCVYNVQIMYSLLLHLCPGIKSWNKRTGVFSSKKKKKKQTIQH